MVDRERDVYGAEGYKSCCNAEVAARGGLLRVLSYACTRHTERVLRVRRARIPAANYLPLPCIRPGYHPPTQGPQSLARLESMPFSSLLRRDGGELETDCEVALHI